MERTFPIQDLMTTKMPGSIFALVVMQLGRRLLAEGSAGFRRCRMMWQKLGERSQIGIEVFVLFEAYHHVITCIWCQVPVGHSFLVRWVCLKMGVLQNFRVNQSFHHIPSLSHGFWWQMNTVAGATLHLADEVWLRLWLAGLLDECQGAVGQ